MPSQHTYHKNPNRNKEGGPSQEQKGYSTSEAILALKDDLIQEIQTSREEEPRTDTTPKWITYATLLFVFLTTVGVGIQDLILHSSDDTFKATLTAQKRSSEQQLRAYVGMAPGDVEDFGTADKQRVRFTRKNYGATPAYDVGFSAVGMNTIKQGEPIDTGPSGCAAPKLPGQFTMFPTVELPWEIRIGGPIFTPDQIQLVKSGDRQFIYWGTVCYHDAFGVPHFTNYCWMYKGKSMTAKDAEGCLTHNDSN